MHLCLVKCSILSMNLSVWHVLFTQLKGVTDMNVDGEFMDTFGKDDLVRLDASGPK